MASAMPDLRLPSWLSSATYCAYQRTDDQAELSWMANQAQRRVTLLIKAYVHKMKIITIRFTRKKFLLKCRKRKTKQNKNLSMLNKRKWKIL